LACGIPYLITKYAVFESALLGEECGTDCGLFVGLEFVGDLCGLSWWEGMSGVTMTYKAKNDRRFANSSFAWVIVSVDVGRGRRSGWHLWMEKRLTEKDELDLDTLVCGSRCSVGHWMRLLESGTGDN
jgi:hypothetical protein